MIKPSPHEDLYKIEFDFSYGKFSSRSCETIMAYDIETSSGYRKPDGEVLGFDHLRYNETLYNPETNKDEINPDFDKEYKEAIDNAEPVSVVYHWQMCIFEHDEKPWVFVGRDWNSFMVFMHKLTLEVRRQALFGTYSINRELENEEALKHKMTVGMKIYDHNFGFEYQHLLNCYEENFV